MAVRKSNPVLTVVKLLLATVIAVALVKIAFFPAGVDAAEDPAVPGATFDDPTVSPTRGDLTASVTLDARVEQDPAQEARADLDGTISQVMVADGAEVAQGAVLARVRQETPVEPRQVTRADGSVDIVEQAPRVRTSDITAPVAGVVDLAILKDQGVTIGETVASVQPSSTTVVAGLTPEQRYRLVDAPQEATVELRSGPGAFTCTGVRIGATQAPASGTSGDPMGAGSSGGTDTALRCAVPADVTVFPGLSGTLTLQTGQVTDALLLPTTAVQGLYQKGTVWVVDEAGARTATEVTLGLTDGKQIEITGGLAQDATVLEFAPAAREGEVAGAEDTVGPEDTTGTQDTTGADGTAATDGSGDAQGTGE